MVNDICRDANIHSTALSSQMLGFESRSGLCRRAEYHTLFSFLVVDLKRGIVLVNMMWFICRFLRETGTTTPSSSTVFQTQ